MKFPPIRVSRSWLISQKFPLGLGALIRNKEIRDWSGERGGWRSSQSAGAFLSLWIPKCWSLVGNQSHLYYPSFRSFPKLRVFLFLPLESFNLVLEFIWISSWSRLPVFFCFNCNFVFICFKFRAKNRHVSSGPVRYVPGSHGQEKEGPRPSQLDASAMKDPILMRTRQWKEEKNDLYDSELQQNPFDAECWNGSFNYYHYYHQHKFTIFIYWALWIFCISSLPLEKLLIEVHIYELNLYATKNSHCWCLN